MLLIFHVVQNSDKCVIENIFSSPLTHFRSMAFLNKVSINLRQEIYFTPSDFTFQSPWFWKLFGIGGTSTLAIEWVDLLLQPEARGEWWSMVGKLRSLQRGSSVNYIFDLSSVIKCSVNWPAARWIGSTHFVIQIISPVDASQLADHTLQSAVNNTSSFWGKISF